VRAALTYLTVVVSRWTRILRVHVVALLLLVSAVACIRAPGVRASQAPPRVGDTLFILSTPSYTVTAYRRDDVIPTATLNRAARTYERLFGDTPPNIFVFLGNDGSTPVVDPPSARDTVRLLTAADFSVGATRAHELARAAAFLMARAWVNAAVEQAAESTESDSAILVPTWFEVASAMLITFDAAQWSAELEQAQRVTGVLSVEDLLGNRDRSVLPRQQAIAMNVQSAALLEYFWERDSDALIGLPARLGRGTSIRRALLDRTMTDRKSVDAAWQNWYRKVQHAGK
jgi:hypothetical protein